MSDYYHQLQAEYRHRGYARFINEKTVWEKCIFEEVELWEREGTFDVYTKTFDSEIVWRKEKILRSLPYQDYINGNLVLIQWTLKNGKELTLAVRRMK